MPRSSLHHFLPTWWDLEQRARRGWTNVALPPTDESYHIKYIGYFCGGVENVKREGRFGFFMLWSLMVKNIGIDRSGNCWWYKSPPRHLPGGYQLTSYRCAKGTAARILIPCYVCGIVRQCRIDRDLLDVSVASYCLPMRHVTALLFAANKLLTDTCALNVRR